MRNKELKRRAQLKLRKLTKMRADPRFKKVVGRLSAERLLFGSEIAPARGYPTLEDALWAGEVEPRILELLPAIVARRPKLFLQAKPVPKDLAKTVKELKRGKPITPFRGVPAENYAQWFDKVAYRKKAKPGLLKSYRFTEEDQKILENLEKRWNENETAVLRRAIRIAAGISSAG